MCVCRANRVRGHVAWHAQRAAKKEKGKTKDGETMTLSWQKHHVLLCLFFFFICLSEHQNDNPQSLEPSSLHQHYLMWQVQQPLQEKTNNFHSCVHVQQGTVNSTPCIPPVHPFLPHNEASFLVVASHRSSVQNITSTSLLGIKKIKANPQCPATTAFPFTCC